MAEWGNVKRIQEITKIDDAGEPYKRYRYTVQTAAGVYFTHDITTEQIETGEFETILSVQAQSIDRSFNI